MKKVSRIVLSSFVILSLIGCGNKRPSSHNSSGELESSSLESSSFISSSLEISTLPSSISLSEQSVSSTSISSENSSSSSTTVSSSSSIEESSSASSNIESSDLSSSEQQSISSSNEESSSVETSEVYYHVIFQNYDETILEEIDVLEGSTATYSGEGPTKEEDDEFTYEFDGWDKDLTNIQSDTTFIAQYKAVAKENWGPIIW